MNHPPTYAVELDRRYKRIYIPRWTTDLVSALVEYAPIAANRMVLIFESAIPEGLLNTVEEDDDAVAYMDRVAQAIAEQGDPVVLQWAEIMWTLAFQGPTW